LVKKLSDFQNTIFLLSFSKDIILNALKEIQIGNGFEYLEKIIQFPYELPKISKEKLEKILLKGIEEIIKVNNIENWDKYYWDKYYYRSLKNNFRNLRHIKRFMNIFEFIPGIIGNEVNSVDQAVMSAIQIFYPKIFNLIKENEDRFTGRISEYDFESNYYKSNIKSLRVEYDELISNATDINSKTDIINLLKILFPKFDTIFDGKYYQAEEYQEWVDKCRICIPEIYETYFRLTVPEYELSRKEFENVIKYSGDLDTLTKIIGEIEHQGKTSSFLEKIINNIKNIENEKAISIINILFDLADGYKSPVKKSISRNFQMDDLIFMSLNNLLLKFKDIEERYNIIKEAIERSNSLFLSVHFISSFDSNDEEKEGKEEEGKENDKIQLLEKPQIELLKNILVSKIKNWAEDDILINHFRLPFLLYRLERWDESNYIKEYLFNICKDDDKLVKLISRFLVRTSSYSSDMILSNESFDLYYNDLKHFIDVKEIEPRIRKIYQDKYMQEEESIEKIGLYLFLEYYDRKRHIR
jgi:predicted KAP-like P-loop ATPase